MAEISGSRSDIEISSEDIILLGLILISVVALACINLFSLAVVLPTIGVLIYKLIREY